MNKNNNFTTMKKILFPTLVCLLFSFNLFSQNIDFDKYFLDKQLRIDLYHHGNSEESNYIFKEFIVEPFWGGSKVSLVDDFNFGTCIVKVFDKESNKLIYSRGYCTLFQEWQNEPEAFKRNRLYEETVNVPLPKTNAIIKIEERDDKNIFREIFSIEYDPDNIFITNERRADYPVYDALVNGDSHEKIDIVIIPDGYTADEMDKFKEDCNTFVEILGTFDPFKKHIDNFNVRGILAPSLDSGTDVPREDVFVRTVVDTHFDTFESDRYCMTESVHKVRDVASLVPYDQIYILVNSTIYGGGGIFNYYSVSTSGNMSSAKVIIHEFGHAFAGLADEYYNTIDNNESYYNLEVEPWEYNITTLVDFDSKWKQLVDKDTPIPTPATEEYKDKVGAFEGGGYTLKGVYRPTYECLMRSFVGDVFCPACYKAIEDMILFYSK